MYLKGLIFNYELAFTNHYWNLHTHSIIHCYINILNLSSCIANHLASSIPFDFLHCYFESNHLPVWPSTYCLHCFVNLQRQLFLLLTSNIILYNIVDHLQGHAIADHSAVFVNKTGCSIPLNFHHYYTVTLHCLFAQTSIIIIANSDDLYIIVVAFKMFQMEFIIPNRILCCLMDKKLLFEVIELKKTSCLLFIMVIIAFKNGLNWMSELQIKNSASHLIFMHIAA